MIKTNQKATLHLLAGGVGTTFGQCVTCPLEVVQTRLQSSHLNFSNIASLNAVLGNELATKLHRCSTGLPLVSYFRILGTYMRHMVHTEGITSLFKGLSPSLIGIVPMKSLYFFCYSEAKFRLQAFKDRPHMVHSLSAAMAQGIVGTITNPIWYIKTRLQLNRRQKSSVVEVVKRGYQKHGMRVFFRGLTATYLGIFESVIYFVIYEELKKTLNLNNRRNSGENFKPGGLVFATMLSKVTATMAMYSHEVVRTRLRQDVKDETGRLKYRGLAQTFRTVYKEEGFRAGLYGGFGTNLLRQVPYTAVMFLTYEGIIYMVGVD